MSAPARHGYEDWKRVYLALPEHQQRALDRLVDREYARREREGRLCRIPRRKGGAS